jgi:hypothetical protein
VFSGPTLAGDDKEKRDRRQREKIGDLEEKLAERLRYPEPSPEQIYFHAQAAALLANLKELRGDNYRFDRLARAADALLESSESILEARRQTKGRDEHDRREAAFELQEDYFRVQQADYFARQWGSREAGSYVRYARSLYQQARRAYDGNELDRAESLGGAASFVVRALENLAQAEIRVPEPPSLP